MTYNGTYARSRVINLLFLLCFITYAASPLIHPGVARHGVSNASGGVRILLLDLLFLNLVHHNDNDLSPAATLSFVRKAGGVLSADDALRLISHAAGMPVRQSLSPEVSTRSFEPGRPSVQIVACRGYNPLYSANSPPLHRYV